MDRFYNINKQINNLKKMKKVNIEKLTKALNGFIQSNKNKTFTRQELGEKLSEAGFNPVVSGIIIPKLFPFEKMGTSRLYGFTKE